MKALVHPLSNKAKSRIGKSPVPAVIEQVKDCQLFIVFSSGECRWVKTDNDPNFRVELI